MSAPEFVDQVITIDLDHPDHEHLDRIVVVLDGAERIVWRRCYPRNHLAGRPEAGERWKSWHGNVRLVTAVFDDETNKAGYRVRYLVEVSNARGGSGEPGDVIECGGTSWRYWCRSQAMRVP